MLELANHVIMAGMRRGYSLLVWYLYYFMRYYKRWVNLVRLSHTPIL